MICPSCGANNLSDFSYCLHCGHPLDAGGQTADLASVDPLMQTRDDMPLLDGGTMAMPGAAGSVPPASPAVRLRVEEGSVDEPFIPLDRPTVVFGRRQESDVVIRDSNVSRMHAQIVRDGPRLIIEDANSSNGTIVNDERIEAPRELRPGDVIRIGDAVFVVEVQGEAGGASESSTMAIELSEGGMTSIAGAPEMVPPGLLGRQPATPVTSIAGPPELVPPGLAPRIPNPLTPPPSIQSPVPPIQTPPPPPSMMDASQTAFADSLEMEEEVSPPPPIRPAAPAPAPAPAVTPRPDVDPGNSIPLAPPISAQSSPQESPMARSSSLPSSSAGNAGGSTSAALDALRRELQAVGQDLASFSGTLGGLADRVERLEGALDSATGNLASVADAIRGPDSSVLKELQGIIDEIDRGRDGPQLDEAVKVLEQLASQPRDIELLLKLSHQAAALESALRIHGRMVAAAPRLRSTLARLTG